jgi:hypothetical protein
MYRYTINSINLKKTTTYDDLGRDGMCVKVRTGFIGFCCEKKTKKKNNKKNKNKNKKKRRRCWSPTIILPNIVFFGVMTEECPFLTNVNRNRTFHSRC